MPLPAPIMYESRSASSIFAPVDLSRNMYASRSRSRRSALMGPRRAGLEAPRLLPLRDPRPEGAPPRRADLDHDPHGDLNCQRQSSGLPRCSWCHHWIVLFFSGRLLHHHRFFCHHYQRILCVGVPSRLQFEGFGDCSSQRDMIEIYKKKIALWR